MKNTKVEVEGGELLLESKEGHYAIIPAKHRQEVMDMVKEGCDDCINNYIQSLPKNSDYAEDGTVVSELYKQKTGKNWNTAKEEGLTDGSYDNNMKLRKRLLSGEFDNKKINGSVNSNVTKTQDYTKATTFADAFAIARKQLGANQIFEYKGRKYGTNLKGEEFKPSEEVLSKYNMNTPKVKERLNTQNKLTTSIYSDKQTTKLEPEYQDWDKIKKRRDEINAMSQADIIREYHKGTDKQYLILDKQKGKMHLYKGDKEISSYNVGTAQNIGDEQTKTVIDVFDKNGNILEGKERQNAFNIKGKLKPGYKSKVAWNKGNKETGAGIYTVSNVNPKNKHYSNAPAWNFINEKGIEVPMALHSSFGNRTAKIKDNDPSNNRLSNGCINGICYDLKDLYKKGYTKGQKLYILPDNKNNKFKISNGKLIFTSKNPKVNSTIKTLNYKPIKLILDEKSFKDKVFQWNDFNDEEELNNTTKPFIQALADNKKKVMQTAKINGDVYNDIAKIAFGIYGTESNFGDTHSMSGNFLRAVHKYIDPKSSSSPDYKSKVTTYMANKDNNSVGLTQIRFSELDKSEKDVLKKLGITNNKQLLNPKDAAIATVGILAMRYRNQLTSKEKQNLMKYLPKKWNKRGNYSDRVKKNSSYLTIKELN